MQGRDRSIAGFVRRLRWIMIAGIFAVVIGYQWLKESVLDFSATDRLIYGILLYACLGSVVTWFALTWVSNRIAQGERAEKKAREEEMYVASIAASSADAILSMDPNGTITSWNKGAEVIFGYKDKDIIILGTAHVSKESARLVASVIEEEKPDTGCVELCESRYQTIRQKDKWQETDIIKVIREKKAFLLLSNLFLASFQKRIADKFDIQPGAEMICAIETAQAVGSEIHLTDRDIRVTLSRTWRVMGFFGKLKLLFQISLHLVLRVLPS